MGRNAGLAQCGFGVSGAMRARAVGHTKGPVAACRDRAG